MAYRNGCVLYQRAEILNSRINTLEEAIMNIKSTTEKLAVADVNMAGSQFRDVNLQDSDFDDVNLTGTRFNNVNLQNAQVADCNIDGLIINGVVIKDVIDK
jgi:uncharacterized protein YjbI with pentapeptide repeats